MKSLIKIVAAVVLLVSACVCLARFRASYVNAEIKRGDLNEAVETNAVVASAAGTNQTAAVSNSTAIVVGASTTNLPETKPPATSPTIPTKDAGSRSLGWLGGFIGCLLLSGGLFAWEIASWFANRAHSTMFATDTAPESDPEYDQAEQLALDGDYIGAVESMREYLKKNPSEQYVAIRIAEIYERDLNNYLAAAMELEEVLNKKIGREKWGWTAIHLANIYSGRLGKSDKAMEVLRRIVKEAPNTAAAKKARERVGGEAQVATEQAAVEEHDEQDPNLPKGFGRKKK